MDAKQLFNCKKVLYEHFAENQILQKLNMKDITYMLKDTSTSINQLVLNNVERVKIYFMD
jgi:hypothetical protein